MMRAVYAFFRKQYGWQINFPADPDQLFDLLRENGVEKCAALAYTHKPGLSRPLNSWLHEFSRTNPAVMPFGSVHPADHDLEETAVECLDRYDFPGLKIHCLVQQCRPDDERLFPLFEAVVERSKAVFMHAGSFPQPSENLGISYVARLLRRFPTLKLIIAHLGLNDLPAYGELLAAYSGLYLDTAFVFQNEMIKTPLEVILEVIRLFPERILYGSDFPFILEPPQNGIARITALDLPPETLDLLFYQNAEQFLTNLGR
jgi:uncharacterized protein